MGRGWVGVLVVVGLVGGVGGEARGALLAAAAVSGPRVAVAVPDSRVAAGVQEGLPAVAAPDGEASPGGPDGDVGPAVPDGGVGAVVPDGEVGPASGSPGPAGGPVPRLAPGVEYGWPLTPIPAVARRFDAPPFRYGRGHRGADLAGSPGQAVLAAREGTVVFAGPVAGRGVVSVEHADGLRTTYEPVTGTAAVGVRVARGDPIGTLDPGHAACPVDACLHWGVRRGRASTSEYMDPLVLLRPRHVRLLPLPDPLPA